MEKDKPGVATITDDKDSRSCNACAEWIEVGEPFIQLRFRQAYFHICFKCSKTVGDGLVKLTRSKRPKARRTK